MGRLPFNPDKMSAKKARSDSPLSVSDLASRIDTTLKRGMSTSVRVVGEVSGFRDRTHWYFDLKDASAVVSCVMFASAARTVAFQPKDGQEILARGRVEYWAKGGKLSFLCDRLEPVGEGALDLAYRRLCDELRTLGWFDPDTKRTIPMLPRRVAVVTSETGAALQDVLDTARKRCPAVEIAIVDVRVQGDSAASEIARAIAALSDNAQTFGIDAIILTRGGGSKEDLWAFNEREVADAIHLCLCPIVAAIGHESDTTIAELVADARCATPTQAAMAVIPDGDALSHQLDSLRRRLASDGRTRLEIARRRLDDAQSRPWMRDPRRLFVLHMDRVGGHERALRREIELRLAGSRSRLERLSARLEANRPAVVHARLRARVQSQAQSLRLVMHHRVEGLSWRVGSLGRELEAIAPHRVLDRGYSWTTTGDGRLVRSAGEVGDGALIRTRLGDGQIDSRVVSGPQSPGAGILEAPKERKSKRRGSVESPSEADQMDLF